MSILESVLIAPGSPINSPSHLTSLSSGPCRTGWHANTKVSTNECSACVNTQTDTRAVPSSHIEDPSELTFRAHRSQSDMAISYVAGGRRRSSIFLVNTPRTSSRVRNTDKHDAETPLLRMHDKRVSQRAIKNSFTDTTLSITVKK